MKVSYLCLMLSIITLISCSSDDGVGDVNLNFKLVNDGQPISAFERFEYPLGYNIFLTKYSLFVSDITLTNEDGTEQVLLDYGWLDLLADQIDAESAEAGSTITVKDFPEGEYTKMRINLGVDESTNTMTPAEFSTNHPLGNTGEYWEGWQSYIFHKVEGKIDSDGDEEFEKNVALHIGSNSAFRTKEVTRNISISKGESTTVTFEIELQDVINVEGNFFDLNAMPQVHSEAALPNVLPLMDNLIEEF